MWWHILEVSAEADKAQVKKAYANIIKGVDQDNDIDEFTKIHQALRMAMKSFKNKEEVKEREHIYSELSDEYIEFIDKIYQDKSKRLNAKFWKDMFACMSFKEEESFAKEYVKFFNEHYLLTDEIWKIIDKNYPLGERKDFKWKDLFDGSFSVDKSEIDQVHKDIRCKYVEDKINLYYLILNKEFESGLKKAKIFIDDYKTDNINKWYMTIAMALNDDGEVDNAYHHMLKANGDPMDAHYLMAGYFTKKSEFAKSKNLLSKLQVDNSYVDLLTKENDQGISSKEVPGVNRLPWTELDFCNNKKKKMFSNGNYNKAIKSDSSGLKALLNKGGKTNG